MAGNDQPPNELRLPAESVKRIMKRQIPSDGRLSRESTETMQDCATKFIHQVTSAANDKCFHDRRRILTADDILYAMKTLGYTDSTQLLEIYMSNYRESVMRADIGSSSLYPPYPQLGPQHGLFQQGSVPPAYAQQGPQHSLFQQGSVPPAYAQQGPHYGHLQQGSVPPTYAQQGSLPSDNSFLQGSSSHFNFRQRSFPPSGRGSFGPRV